MLQPRVTWVACCQKGKKVANGDDQSSEVARAGNKGVYTMTNK
jgi:hypothetical protein